MNTLFLLLELVEFVLQSLSIVIVLNIISQMSITLLILLATFSLFLLLVNTNIDLCLQSLDINSQNWIKLLSQLIKRIVSQYITIHVYIVIKNDTDVLIDSIDISNKALITDSVLLHYTFTVFTNISTDLIIT